MLDDVISNSLRIIVRRFSAPFKHIEKSFNRRPLNVADMHSMSSTADDGVIT
jgi:hypothetical protein